VDFRIGRKRRCHFIISRWGCHYACLCNGERGEVDYANIFLEEEDSELDLSEPEFTSSYLNITRRN
jgi:hypothetical protein